MKWPFGDCTKPHKINGIIMSVMLKKYSFDHTKMIGHRLTKSSLNEVDGATVPNWSRLEEAEVRK